MIIGIGCDVVEHNITKSLEWSTNNRIMNRVFSKKEIKLFKSDKSDKFISGRFAAKEAVLKCMGTGMKDGIALVDIQILQSDAGKPIIRIEKQVKKIAEQLGIVHWHISISHTTTTSTAFVIAEGYCI